MESKTDIPLEVIKELCRQSEMWEMARWAQKLAGQNRGLSTMKDATSNV